MNEKTGWPLLIVITGPTATGKTRLAAGVAAELKGEVISADSRQVYRGMDIGSGKDLSDFIVGNVSIPYHLIDIADPGEEYSVYAFQKDFVNSYHDIIKRDKQPVLCGGTGLYVEAAVSGYRLLKVPENKELRDDLSERTMPEMAEKLADIKNMHNVTDTNDRARLVRAIEIATWEAAHHDVIMDYPVFDHRIFAIHFERSVLRERITARLRQRLDEGMVDEVRQLLQGGLKPAQLMFYGLEYRYLTMYITGSISYDTMFEKLNTAIHQFAKRQLTWFRRMERKGFHIHWIDGHKSQEVKLKEVLLKLYQE